VLKPRLRRFAASARQAPWLLAAAIVMIAALAELTMGREARCTCGYIKLWHGIVNSSENSQHVTDWYTFTHIIHGIGFFALTSPIARSMPMPWRFVLAVAIEAVWEVFENTPFVIERYRATTISLDYYGDSVVNSVADIGAMTVGFWIASRVRWWTSLLAVIVIEIALAATIRDNLTLNILMLIHPIDAIRRWQLGA